MKIINDFEAISHSSSNFVYIYYLLKIIIIIYLFFVIFCIFCIYFVYFSLREFPDLKPSIYYIFCHFFLLFSLSHFSLLRCLAICVFPLCFRDFLGNLNKQLSCAQSPLKVMALAVRQAASQNMFKHEKKEISWLKSRAMQMFRVWGGGRTDTNNVNAAAKRSP